MFSPGNKSNRTTYSTFSTQLSSEGNVVAAVEHRLEIVCLKEKIFRYYMMQILHITKFPHKNPELYYKRIALFYVGFTLLCFYGRACVLHPSTFVCSMWKKKQQHVWNLFKVFNGDTRTTSTFTHCSGVSIGDFE